MKIHFGRDTAGDLYIAEKREWLITNGIGGYGSGTIAGSITRGYHGLLVAALRPPLDRRVMLVKLEEMISYQGIDYDLTSNRWGNGSIDPKGFKNLQSFDTDGGIPCWTYACADAIVEKRIWMEYGANTTYVAYKQVSGGEPVKIKAKAIADNRVYHNTGQYAWPVTIQSIPDGIQVISGKDGALPLTLKMADASVTQFNELYSDFYLPEEAARGLQASDTHVHVADFEAVIGVGHTIILLASAEGNPQIDQDAFARRQQYEQALLEKWMKQQNISSVDTISDDERQLVFAADQFVVKRIAQNQPDGRSIIAGYPWFEDWGRDTMIGLTGLTLLTGRQQEASLILATFAQYISNGMLPNRFPDTGDIPQYNTIDATLWYFHAIRSYYEATHDLTLIRDLFPKLKDIIDWHVKGTRFNIHMDPNDHLIEGGQDGVQLTWMDALVNGIVITPRIGKPVEVNALWYNALNSMVIFARILGESPAVYQTMADAAKKGFARFWNDEKGYLFDVLDGPNGNEDILRPNQILAVSLPDCPLTTAQQQKVVNICAEQLWTSVGLRSLASHEKDYKGFYGGDQTNRDSAYHQGTVWSWLIGPFIKAHIAVYQDTEAASRFLDPLFDHFTAVGIGTISEIFDGDAPFNPKGCIAQAWSIGQMLEAYVAIQQLKKK